jgi:glycosyltransferase involved in cell wall biosynthesis
VLKAATTGKKNGKKVFFAGEKPSKLVTKDFFDEIRWIKIPKMGRVAATFGGTIGQVWPLYPYPKQALDLKNQIKKVVNELRPDIIHAHNIFVGIHALDAGIPMVLDDHELYSVNVQARMENMNGRKKIEAKIKQRVWKKWEERIGEKFPIITTTKNQAKHHERYCKNVFVVPNYPRSDFISPEPFMEAVKNELVSAYIGKDIGSQNPHRNIEGLHEIFSSNKIGKLVRIGVSQPNNSNIESTGFVHFSKAYQILQQKCHVGLMPWHPHWLHKYSSPNKPYEYAHCGLWVLTTSDLENVVDDFGDNCDTFDTYEKLKELLEHYNQNPDELNKKRKKSFEMAKTKLIWEVNEDQILNAYKKA